jgi:HTH-type transcriptional regulator, sugar sensing transcriptional regulator
MNSFEFLEKLGFSSNEAKVYGTLIKHKVLNGYEIAKLSGVARSLVYEVINRLIAKGAVIRIDGEPNFYKPIEYQDLIRSIKEENEKNIACAERELQQLATENVDVDYVMNIVGEEKYVAKAKELIDSAQAEISLSIWQESFEVLRSNIENAISRGVKVYIFTFESISVAGATVYSYNINDVSTLFPYRRTTIIIDGGECLVGEEGDRNVYVHTRNHSVVSLATDEIVLNVFWNKLIEKENLLSKGCSGADFFASHTQFGGALRHYRRDDQEFSCIQFSKGENSKWQKMLNDYRRAKPKNLSAAKSSWAQDATSFI